MSKPGFMPAGQPRPNQPGGVHFQPARGGEYSGGADRHRRARRFRHRAADDMHGVVYIPFRNGWDMLLARALRAAGLRVDLNRLLG
jgi:hypothetical protein